MSEEDKIMCKYGDKCYQKNKEHLEKYKHPKKRSLSPNDKPSKKYKPSSSPNELDDNLEGSDETGLENAKKLINEYFLVDMPQDFYDFWSFCVELNKNKPENALKAIDLHLVGPFDVLAGSQKVISDEKHLLHWRYYYDPPEFQTIIRGDDKSEHHMGYFRDKPEEKPSFIAENSAKNDCILKPLGDNLFAAINIFIERILSKANPFKKIEITKLQKALTKKAKELKYDLSKKSSLIEKRKSQTVCKTFHTAGIVVPFNKKTTVGYRELTVTDKELVKICDRIAKSSKENMSSAMSDLQPVITMATIAVDECDFGTALELGIDLFCYGNEQLDGPALRLLKMAYSVLDRDTFAKIADVHLKNRKKGMPHVVNY